MFNDSVIDKVEAALEDIRPHLRVDGGDVELLEVTEDLTVKLRWLGACKSCSMSIMTLRMGVEKAIRLRLPEVKDVIAVNDLDDRSGT